MPVFLSVSGGEQFEYGYNGEIIFLGKNGENGSRKDEGELRFFTHFPPISQSFLVCSLELLTILYITPFTPVSPHFPPFPPVSPVFPAFPGSSGELVSAVAVSLQACDHNYRLPHSAPHFCTIDGVDWGRRGAHTPSPIPPSHAVKTWSAPCSPSPTVNTNQTRGHFTVHGSRGWPVGILVTGSRGAPSRESSPGPLALCYFVWGFLLFSDSELRCASAAIAGEGRRGAGRCGEGAVVRDAVVGFKATEIGA